MNKKPRTHVVYLIALFILLGLTINSCGNQSEDIGDIRVERAELVETTLGQPEEIPMENCDNQGTMTYKTETEVRRSKNISIGSKASASAGADIGISEIVIAKLQAEIENTYQQDFGTAVTQANSLDFVVPAQSDVILKVTWAEKKYTSNVNFKMNGKTYQVPYTYSFRVPIRTETEPGTKCPSCDVTGTVFNKDDHQPLANVAIGFTYGGPILGYTDPNGYFEIDCREATFDQFPLRLEVDGVVQGCGVSFKSQYYIKVGEQRHNISIPVSKSALESFCSQK